MPGTPRPRPSSAAPPSRMCSTARNDKDQATSTRLVAKVVGAAPARGLREIGLLVVLGSRRLVTNKNNQCGGCGPGPITNEPLGRLPREAEFIPREGLVERDDYALLPEKAWELLVRWYGRDYEIQGAE